MTLRSHLLGVGHSLPTRVVENSEFKNWIETSDEWIESRSGIKRRHFAAKDQKTSDLAIEAAINAIKNAKIKRTDIDAIIVATSTPDTTFPSVATIVQGALGITKGFAFDVQAVCAGFIFALATADALIVSKQAKRVLVIGAETFSRIMNWEDRTTSVLFGDGAGAIIIEAVSSSNLSTDTGILATDLNSDGRYRDLLYVDGGVSSTQTTGVLVMQGKEVFKHAVEKLSSTAHAVLEKAGLSPSDVDWMVPHQANIRIIKATAQKMKLPMTKVIVTVNNHGNTSAASIPLALSVANLEKKFKKGDLILMEAIGGGLAWGSILLRL
ncbi:MAG: 3-oxoacyl-ACP synthase [Rhodobacteraceae bacterium]|nr:3-oxoacyl-ACP synthase [Paracoccaceae bacterium]MBT6436662.1 ketoacyl-ACP synthase III [Paracoccaceae bacterium]|tara:strand:- start:1142 stop:2116 length:975 start_codon:yes stop_codon:yes gene_type:complete